MTAPEPDSVPGLRYLPRPDGGLDIHTVYTRCPTCQVVATSTGVDYALTPDGGFDPMQPIKLSCIAGAHRYTATVDEFLIHDAPCTCRRCGVVFAAPAAADQVVCPGCRLYQDGPFLDAVSGRRAEIDATRREYLAAVRARLAAHRPPSSGPEDPDGRR